MCSKSFARIIPRSPYNIGVGSSSIIPPICANTGEFIASKNRVVLTKSTTNCFINFIYLPPVPDYCKLTLRFEGNKYYGSGAKKGLGEY
jgi:hypothetical protein